VVGNRRPLAFPPALNWLLLGRLTVGNLLAIVDRVHALKLPQEVDVA